jgi:hypothetical protein
MRFRLVGDHSELHGGCAAVVRVLTATLNRVGRIVAEGEDHDVLVMNGEGSMHHDSTACRQKLRQIETAQEFGKATWLVNSVWQANDPDCDRILRRLDGFWVRGPVSAADLRARHGLDVPWGLDLSYFDPVETVPAPIDFGGETVTTDLWHSPFGGFVRPTAGALAALPYLDFAALSWNEAIASIATAGLLITGRHHAMYAACKARRPFVPIAGNTHKFEDLLRAAGVAVPVCSTWAEVRRAREWLARNPSEFERLFDWMDRQPNWSFGEPARQRGWGRSAADQAFADARARMVAGDADGSVARLDAGLAEDPGAGHLHRLLRATLPIGGDVARAALAIARDRLAGACDADKDYDRLVLANQGPLFASPRLAGWTGVANPWHPDTPDPAAAIADAFATARDELEREAIRGILMAGAARRLDWTGAEIVERIADDWARPEALKHHDAIRFTVQRRRFEPAHVEAVIEALWRDGLDEATRADRIEYLLVAGRIDRDLLDRLVETIDGGGADGRGLVSGLTVAAAHQFGDVVLARDLAGRLPAARRSADQIASVAALYDDEDFRPARDFLAAAEAQTRRVFERLGDPGRSIALVGNGDWTGSPLGAEIDAHDEVIRFNDFRLAGAAAALGRRIGLVSTVLQHRDDFDQPNARRADHGLLLSIPGVLHVRQPWAQVLRHHRGGLRFSTMPDTVRLPLQRTLRRLPSSGLFLAAHLVEVRGGSEGMRLFHMPLLAGGTDARRHQGRATGRHDWNVEAAVAADLKLAIRS